MKAIFTFFCWLCALLVSTLSANVIARPLIIDTDAAIDDVIAILYLTQRPEIDIKAITIAATGEAHCKPAQQNITALLKLAEMTNIPVACGPSQPISGNHHFPQWISHTADTVMGMQKFLPKVSTSITEKNNGVDLLISTLEKFSEPVDILALGPLTNLATAFNKNPAIKAKIRMIYMMGGAVNVPGNIFAIEKSIKNKSAEWNLYIDPVATDVVFRSSVPITLVPLDITNQVPIDSHFYQDLSRQMAGTPVGKFIFKLFQKNKEKLLSHTWYLWDPLAAAILVDESIVSMETKKISIAVTPEEISGATLIDNVKGNPIRVCTKVNTNFNKVMLTTLMSKTPTA